MIYMLASILLKAICFRDGGIQLSKPVCCCTPFGDVLGNVCLSPPVLRPFPAEARAVAGEQKNHFPPFVKGNNSDKSEELVDVE